MKRYLPVVVVLAAITLSSCTEPANEAPEIESDSGQSYKAGTKAPVDDNVYVIKGEVIGPVNDVTRQVEPAQGSLQGSAVGGFGSVTGSFTGPVEAGKGFVRLRVESISPDTESASVGDVTILKTADTKVKALMNGDIVTFKCRRQYENVAAVRENSSANIEEIATWELDYCRLFIPVITVKDQPKVENEAAQ